MHLDRSFVPPCFILEMRMNLAFGKKLCGVKERMQCFVTFLENENSFGLENCTFS